jgi:hypothetical protein
MEILGSKFTILEINISKFSIPNPVTPFPLPYPSNIYRGAGGREEERG